MMMEGKGMPCVEVCFSPKLFPFITTKEPFVVVLTDILRATTSIVTAFANGVERIIPVHDAEDARKFKEQGFLVATEQDGKKLDFADFGNSAFSFTRERVEGRTLVYCTTNGTRALAVIGEGRPVVFGAFINFTALKEWLVKRDTNVVILCSGWKNKFCIEDSLYAGALAESLLQSGHFTTNCDSVHAASDLWSLAKGDIPRYLEKASHTHRLNRLGLDDVIPYSFNFDITRVIPIFHEGKIEVEKN
jgi:2-phosphosulfolactate phosphatase